MDLISKTYAQFFYRKEAGCRVSSAKACSCLNYYIFTMPVSFFGTQAQRLLPAAISTAPAVGSE